MTYNTYLERMAVCGLKCALAPIVIALSSAVVIVSRGSSVQRDGRSTDDHCDSIATGVDPGS